MEKIINIAKETQEEIRKEIIVPEKIQEMMRKLKSDEEHSRFFCDLAECKLCEARKHIEEERNWSDNSLP